MFCVQCEQTIRTSQAIGCQYLKGACGKTAEVSDLQDVLILALQGVSFWATCCQQVGIYDQQLDRWCFQAFFSTLTNVNFDPQRMQKYINQAIEHQGRLRHVALAAGAVIPPLTYAAKTPLEDFEVVKPLAAVNRGADELDPDVISLRLLCLYALKGVAAYLEHAAVLLQYDPETNSLYHKMMSELGDEPDDLNRLLELAMEIGKLNFQVMQMLDKGATHSFGHPTPTQVNIQPVKGKCILVSGHDFQDLLLLLQQTEGTGIQVYTHGEMLPAHAYPTFQKFPHLAGNYGGAWYQQQHEFADFPGAILMTSNCLLSPESGGYGKRIFTRSMVGWPGVSHIEGEDFSELITCAQQLEGFTDTSPAEFITTGYANHTLSGVAPALIEQVKQQNIRHFFLIGGCDGARPEREYTLNFAKQVPEDCLMLTLGCAKYRINQHDFGTHEGVPRLLDVGQCNDAYSAIQLTIQLSQAFNCDINQLPLTLVLSWFEQKAIAILLTLLALGVRGIYTGPTLPGFLTQNVVEILQAQFDLRVTGDPEQDLQEILHA